MTTSQDPSNVPPIDDWNRLLAGRVAVVTGGGTGIGGATARLFARHGAHVEIAELDAALADPAVADITAAGGSARAHVLDVRTEEGVAALAEAVTAEHPHVQVLVNNVGDYRPLVRFRKSGPESWDAMYRTNFWHVVAVTHAFLEGMIAGFTQTKQINVKLGA